MPEGFTEADRKKAAELLLQRDKWEPLMIYWNDAKTPAYTIRVPNQTRAVVAAMTWLMRDIVAAGHGHVEGDHNMFAIRLIKPAHTDLMASLHRQK